MGQPVEEFDSWLSSLLGKLELDDDVFSGYITGILETEEDSSVEESIDALVEILSEATTVPVRDTCSEIAQRWRTKAEAEKAQKEAERKAEHKSRANAALTPAMPAPSTASSSNSSASRKAEMSEEARLRKEAVLAQFAYEDEDDEVDEDGDPIVRQASQASRIDATLEKLSNSNRQVVANAQKAERDKQQADHVARVAQTKGAREKQLQQEQDRKDKAKQKVQKRERRR